MSAAEPSWRSSAKLSDLDQSLTEHIRNEVGPVTGTCPQPGMIDVPFHGARGDTKFARRFLSRLAASYQGEDLRFALRDALQNALCPSCVIMAVVVRDVLDCSSTDYEITR